MFSFKNIGRKLMSLARVMMWIGIVCSVIMGLCVILAPDMLNVTYNGSPVEINSGARIISAVFIILIGSILSWVGEMATYGFGHLIDTVDKIKNSDAE